MEIKVFHHKCFIKKASSEELEVVKKKLRVWNKLFSFTENQYELNNLYNEKERTFPIGYLPIIKDFAKEKKIELIIHDERELPYPHLNFQKLIKLPELYDTQKEALESIINKKTGIISSVTGSGKTRLIIEAFHYFQVNTLIIVPSTNIRDKMAMEFKELYGEHNVTTSNLKLYDDKLLEPTETDNIDDSEIEDLESDDVLDQLGSLFSKTDYLDKRNKLDELGTLFSDSTSSSDDDDLENEFLNNSSSSQEDYEKAKLKAHQAKVKKLKKKIKPITIVCYQSLRNISRYFLKTVECVLIDECHHSSSRSIRDALLDMPNAAYRFYFSATPWRDTAPELKLLVSAIGNDIIYELRGKEGVDKGIISKPELVIINPPAPPTFIRNISAKNFRLILEKGIIGNSTRNAYIVKEAIDALSNQKNVFIAVNEIKHLEILKARLERKKVKPIIITGLLSAVEKMERIEEIRNQKEGCIVIGTMAIGEGTDMPNINHVILAAGGKSTIRFLQRIGRGTRKSEDSFIVVDFKDWFHPVLLKHSNFRFRKFREEYEDPQINPILKV